MHSVQSTCPTGYFGTNCKSGVVYNETTVCSSKGTCSAPNTCTCSAGYLGLLCENVISGLEISTVAGSSSTPGFGGDSGPATSAQLNQPNSLQISPSGEMYISDSTNHVIRKVLLDGTIVTIAGSPGVSGSSGDGQAASAKLFYPAKIFLTSSHELYIADSNNNKIRKISSNGAISTIAGTGTGGFGGDNQLATSANLFAPRGVFVTLNGEVFIADTDNHAIRKIGLDGKISTVAGTPGSYGSSGNGGPATSAKLRSPYDVFVTSYGEI